MNILNGALQWSKRALRRRRKGREHLRRAPAWDVFFRPFIEILEDRTLLSADLAQLDGIIAPRTGVLGDATGLAVVNAVSFPETAPSRFDYLGYPAQRTADKQLTVFATGDIYLSSLRPDSLREQGIRSLVVQGSDPTNDTLHVDLSHGDLPLDVTFNGGVGGFDTLVVSGANDGSYTPGKVFGDGTVQVGQTKITFTGLEPVVIDGTSVTGTQAGLNT